MAKKKKRSRASSGGAVAAGASSGRSRSGAAVSMQAEDAMSRCAMFCQEQHWREALLLLRQVQEKAKKNSNKPLFESLEAARGKIEYSLRRQMAAALLTSAENMLRREFLLDVGE